MNYLDLTNMRFGRLTYIKPTGNHDTRNIYWLCKCDCGKETIVSTKHRNRTKSCGCLRGGIENLVGQKFGNMTVIARAGSNKKRSKLWECRCDCGRKQIVRGASLKKKNKHSCGCQNRWKGYEEISGTHWRRIINNAKLRHISFNLTIQDAWEIFKNQNMECALTNIPIKFAKLASPETTASLDRIDSTLGYTKTNVQWVHKQINMMKNNMEQQAFINMCKIVAVNN
jgi:hypothetical protein